LNLALRAFRLGRDLVYRKLPHAHEPLAGELDGVGKRLPLALDGSKLVCRNSKGKVLASVPKAVRESETRVTLLELRDWLARHAAECRSTVERWMLRSLPVPVVLLEEVWKDPDWRAPLLNLLVQTAGAEPGFLRDIQPERGLGLVDIDGESQWVRQATEVVIPHPIRVTVLAEYRMPEVAED
jgi:hypothetical protein